MHRIHQNAGKLINLKKKKPVIINNEETEIVLVPDDSWTTKDVIKCIIDNSHIKSTDKSLTVLNVQHLVDQVEKWRKFMPRVTPYYAVKCSDSNIVLEVLASLQLNFDCSSYDEMKKVLAVGVEPKRIIYAHTTKPEVSIKCAKQHGIDLLTFDSDIELLKIKKIHPKARLLIRIKNDAESAICVLGNKFGCCPFTEAPILLRIAKKLELNVVGVCLHVGSLSNESTAYVKGIMISKDLFKIGTEVGLDMKILNIGGGFSGNSDTDMEDITEKINWALDENFPSDGQIEIIAEPGRFFVETAFTLACLVHSAKRPISLVTNSVSEDLDSRSTSSGSSSDKKSEEDIVSLELDSENIVQTEEERTTPISIEEDVQPNVNDCGSGSGKSSDSSEKSSSINKEIEICCEEIYDAISDFSSQSQSSQKNNSIMYFMNNGIYSSFGGVLWKRLTIQPEPLEPLPGPDIECSLWGPTCDGKDIVCTKVFLPPLPIPSWLVFPYFGAYTCTVSTNFNGFTKPLQFTYAPKSTMLKLADLQHNKSREKINWIEITKDSTPKSKRGHCIPSHLSFEKTLSYLNEPQQSVNIQDFYDKSNEVEQNIKPTFTRMVDKNLQIPYLQSSQHNESSESSDSEAETSDVVVDPPITVNPVYSNIVNVLKYNRRYYKNATKCRKCYCDKCSECFSFLGAVVKQGL